MSDIKVVCDASYDDKLRLTGYAGGVYATKGKTFGATYLYQGVAGELRNIQEGEFTAILVGLSELSRHVDLGSVEVDTIEIYSDSKNSVRSLNQWADPDYVDPSPHINHLMQKVRAICKKHDWFPIFDHVNSHVSQESATGIERLNIIADKRAAEMRKAALSRMLNPSVANSQHVTVLLPAIPNSADEAEAFRQLAVRLGEQGKHIRAFIEQSQSDQKHPFIEGVEQFSRQRQQPPARFFKQYSYNAQATHYGLDMTLYRYHILKRGGNSTFELNHTPAEARAALASRLLYGDPSPELQHMDSPTGRQYSTSGAVLDLMNPLNGETHLRPKTVQGWVATYLDYVKIPHHQGLDAVLKYAGIDPGSFALAPREEQLAVTKNDSTHDTPTSDIHQQLGEVYDTYFGQIDPLQLSRKMVDTLLQNDYPQTPLIRDSLVRFAGSQKQGKRDVFIARLIKQADKITPPDWQRHPVVSDNSVARPQHDTGNRVRIR